MKTPIEVIRDIVLLDPICAKINLTDTSDYLTSVIESSIAKVSAFCNFPIEMYPKYAKGYYESSPDPDNDISSASSNWLNIMIDSQIGLTLYLELANDTTAEAIAADIQAKIRAQADNYPVYRKSIQGVTVEYVDDDEYGYKSYVITSGSYGHQSSIMVSDSEIARMLGLQDGSVEYGDTPNPDLDKMVAEIAKRRYKLFGEDEVKSETIGKYSYTKSATADELTDFEKSCLLRFRKLR
jgi:hypothetical protein